MRSSIANGNFRCKYLKTSEASDLILLKKLENIHADAAEVLEVHVLDVEHVAVGVLLIVEVVPGVHANFLEF